MLIYEAFCLDETQGHMKGQPLRQELDRVGLLFELANYYNTRGAFMMLDGHYLQCKLAFIIVMNNSHICINNIWY